MPSKRPLRDPSRKVAADPQIQEPPPDLGALIHILEAAMHDASAASPVVAEDSPALDATAAAIEPRPLTISEPTPASPSEAAAFDEVARSLAAAEACVPLLAKATGLMRLAALDVVRAETARAGGLLHLLRFLRGDLVPPRTFVLSSAVLLRVAQSVESECRLRGIALTTRSSVADVMFTGDETLLANTLFALLLATFALVEQVPNAGVTLSVSVSADGDASLAIGQEHIAAPAAWSTPAASSGLQDDGGIVPAVAINAARYLAAVSGGRFEVAAGQHSSLLTLVLPALPPA